MVVVVVVVDVEPRDEELADVGKLSGNGDVGVGVSVEGILDDVEAVLDDGAVDVDVLLLIEVVDAEELNVVVVFDDVGFTVEIVWVDEINVVDVEICGIGVVGEEEGKES